ncbi:2-hydroxyisoflavanone dehydratase-like [Lotus japonicus]|uniref:2-hydroxyisoflavanone dehydratase-like n=1 Tax=Lotus japonicus TaxID=34305 RepID=UPI002584EE82|nr:2-hydroxyisoflavanone dehydratase-like [Lotus japonicus]
MQKSELLCPRIEMASTTTNITKELVAEIPPFLRIFNDGTVERPLQAPAVPPLLDDPQTELSTKDITISHHPTISARLFLPKKLNQDHHVAEKVPILVYFHGGAFILESAFSKSCHDHFKTFVPQTNVLVVCVEYRLAPEHPLPACYHDCWAALQWVSSHSTKSLSNPEPWLIDHGDLNRIFIGGDSAGGNIAHNIAMRAGIEVLPGDVKLSGAFIVHPFFNSSYPIGSEPIIEPEQNIDHKIWNLVYPSAPGGVDNPKLNPVGPGAPSLATLGCSRIIVCVAGKDRFKDRAIWYYEAVKKSGWQGKLELFEEEDEDHIYHWLKPESESAKKLFKRLASFLHEE